MVGVTTSKEVAVSAGRRRPRLRPTTGRFVQVSLKHKLGSTSIDLRDCPKCREKMPSDCFRKRANACVWCVYESMAKRASARFGDKAKLAAARVRISRADFVAWYVGEPDRCAYCGLTFAELRRLRIRRRGGYCVAWDIDRIDSSLPYQLQNLALSCFVCNMAKGDTLTADEAQVIGKAVRQVWNSRLSAISAA